MQMIYIIGNTGMHCPIHLTLFDTKDAWLLGGGTLHMKAVGMLVVSLRGVKITYVLEKNDKRCCFKA